MLLALGWISWAGYRRFIGPILVDDGVTNTGFFHLFDRSLGAGLNANHQGPPPITCGRQTYASDIRINQRFSNLGQFWRWRRGNGKTRDMFRSIAHGLFLKVRIHCWTWSVPLRYRRWY